MDYGAYNSSTVELAVDLGNAELATGDDVAGFLQAHREWFSPRTRMRLTGQERAELTGLAVRVRSVFGAESEEAVIAELNQLLARYRPDPQLTKHDGALHVHYSSDDAPAIEQLTVSVSVGVTMLVVGHGWDRLGKCQAPDCDNVYVDTSRNRSRRYCSDTCASRATVAAYRARKREEPTA